MSTSGWVLLILVLVILALIIWWWPRRRPSEAVPHAPPQAATPPQPPKPDDLTIIEGIGPKIADVLNRAGITTFAELAATDVNRLTAILNAAGLQFHNPGTWPEQAKLAADGKMDELQVLKDSLKGGRRE